MSKRATASDLLPIEAVAPRLGLSRWRTYDLVRKGLLPGALRLGRRVLVRRKVFEAWLAGETIAPPQAQGTGNRD
jgi:excisionase family DNA binding protein